MNAFYRMEVAKQGWNFGVKSRKQQQQPAEEQKKGMTVREHMTQLVYPNPILNVISSH